MNITDDIIVAAIGFLASALVGLFSFLSSKRAIDSETEKMKTTWAHDENQQYAVDFAKMLTAVKFFIDSKTTAEHRNAVEKINLIRVKSNGAIASLTDLLYTEVAVASITNVDWWKVEKLLANLVDAKRKLDGHTQSPD